MPDESNGGLDPQESGGDEGTPVQDAGTTEEPEVTPDTPVEVEYYRNGGILHYVLRDYHKAEKN